PRVFKSRSPKINARVAIPSSRPNLSGGLASHDGVSSHLTPAAFSGLRAEPTVTSTPASTRPSIKRLRKVSGGQLMPVISKRITKAESGKETNQKQKVESRKLK